MGSYTNNIKMEIKSNLGNRGIMMIVISIFLINIVSAGVSIKRVVEVYPEESHVESLILQNLVAEGPDLVFEGTVVEGGDIVSFADSDKITVPNGEILEMPLNIKAPTDSSIGDVHNVMIIVRSYPSNPDEADNSDSTGVGFLTGVGIRFDVKVVSKPPASIQQETQPVEERPAIGSIWIWVIIALIILIIIIWWAMKRKE